MKNKIKTILFAGLVAAMILPFSVMPETHAMQQVIMKDDRSFHSIDISTKKVTHDSTHMLRDSKATSFNPIYFEHTYSTDINEILDRTSNRR